MKPKRRTQKEHSERRCAERFGVKLSQFIWDNILHQIHAKKARFVKKQSIRVSIWDVDVLVREQDVINDRIKPGPLTVRVVYDSMRKCLSSVLTLDMDCELEEMKLEEDVLE